MNTYSNIVNSELVELTTDALKDTLKKLPPTYIATSAENSYRVAILASLFLEDVMAHHDDVVIRDTQPLVDKASELCNAATHVWYHETQRTETSSG